MFKIKDEPIIDSLMDVDFYKFTMGQLIHQKHADVSTRFSFKNRTKSVLLAKEIPMEELREHLDHARTLSFNNSELHYLRGTNEYQERMFREPYLEFLRGYKLPEYNLDYFKDDFILDFEGSWSKTTHWETIALSIINELYYKKQLAKMSRLERDAFYATGIKNLLEKIKILRQYPELPFSDFSTRRRSSRSWQRYVVEIIANELPTQFKGTSNTKLSMDFGSIPTGTSAHEMDMGYSGIYHDSDEAIRGSHRRFVDDWYEMYGHALSIDLPDTFGSEWYFRNTSEAEARRQRGLRQDSGDPFKFGDRAIKFWQDYGINPKEKMIIFSDGLEVEKMIALHKYFHGRVIDTYGWGTNLANDLGLMALSMIVKLMMANGHGTVKLSDNLNKGMGIPGDIEYFKRIFNYMSNFSETCKY